MLKVRMVCTGTKLPEKHAFVHAWRRLITFVAALLGLGPCEMASLPAGVEAVSLLPAASP